MLPFKEGRMGKARKLPKSKALLKIECIVKKLLSLLKRDLLYLIR